MIGPSMDATSTTPGPGRDATDATARRAILRQAASIAVAVMPFGVAFGALGSAAGLEVWQTSGFSLLVFTGSAQLAAVQVLADGGAAAAAIAAGALLNLRSLAFGVAMAPVLRGPLWWRALAAQLMIDEAMAVGSGPTDRRLRRFGYLAGGVGVFLTWNVSTLVGAVAAAGAEDLITALGVDATIPAAFLALLWPRLREAPQRRAALVGAVVAAVAVPLTPPGIPILLAGLAVLATGRTGAPAGTGPGAAG